MSDWRDGYDDWKLRSPDWDDDPCAEVRAECARDINELCEKVDELRGLLKMTKRLLDAVDVYIASHDFDEHLARNIELRESAEEYRRMCAEAYRALGLPDPNAPVEEEIAF